MNWSEPWCFERGTANRHPSKYWTRCQNIAYGGMYWTCSPAHCLNTARYSAWCDFAATCLILILLRIILSIGRFLAWFLLPFAYFARFGSVELCLQSCGWSMDERELRLLCIDLRFLEQATFSGTIALTGSCCTSRSYSARFCQGSIWIFFEYSSPLYLQPDRMGACQ